MRIDVVTIFPEYLAPLDLSLIGKARREGRLDVRVHDLREHTHDRHHTVDDTPYGGGAGMVMRPQPWSEALEAVLASAEPGSRPFLIVPGPGGVPFTQRRARELAAEDHLVFACGRYEGIDERVYEFAQEAFDSRVEVVSLGDYVLNGGEVASLAVIEAVARLVPGVVGNAESLVEESHEDGLLEYPVYTKPATWRGLDVPPVLLSGDHGAIAAWRHDQRLERTARRRPDLLHPARAPFRVRLDESDAADAYRPVDGTGSSVAHSVSGVAGASVHLALPADVGELFVLCLADAAVRSLPTASATWSVDDVSTAPTWVLRVAGRLVGAVRAQAVDGEWRLDRLVQAADLPGHEVRNALVQVALGHAPRGVRTVTLEVHAPTRDELKGYAAHGLRPVRTARGGPAGSTVPGVVTLVGSASGATSIST